jgi:hypothetical protein
LALVAFQHPNCSLAINLESLELNSKADYPERYFIVFSAKLQEWAYTMM